MNTTSTIRGLLECKTKGLFVVFLFCLPFVTEANVTVTPASNGTCLNVSPGAFTSIGNIVISENSNSDFGSGTNKTIILTAPTNYEFNAGVGSATCTSGKNMTVVSIAVTNSTITVTITVSGTNKSDDLTISGIQARATASGAANGSITRTLLGGGTAAIAGDAAGGGVDHGTLTTGKTVTTFVGGPWNLGSTWIGGVVPGTCDSVIITLPVTVSSAVNVKSVRINALGSLTTSANFTTSANIINLGTITVSSATMDINGGLSNTGTVNVNGGATLTLDGASSFSTATSISGTCNLNAATTFSSTLAANGTVNVNAASSATGLVTVPGTLSINANFSAPNITVSAGGVYDLNSGTTTITGTLTVDGTATVSSGQSMANLAVSSTGSYSQNSGVTNVTTAAVITGTSTTSSNFNTPSLTVSSGGNYTISGSTVAVSSTTTVNGSLTNSGTLTSPTVNVNSGGTLTANSAVTVSTAFNLNGTGVYVHNNSTNAGTSIFSGTETFSPTSTIIVTNWSSGGQPLAYYVSGNFGNVTLSYNNTWDQDGLFAPAKIKGTLRVTKGSVYMDDGTGMTTSLTLQDVYLSGTAEFVVNSGTDRNLTLVTNNYADSSASPYVTAFMLYSYGVLTYTCHGDFYVDHDFSAVQGTGSDVASANVQIDGDLNIAGGKFDFNYRINGSLILNVDGNTNITVGAGTDWSHLIYSQTQFMQYTTNHLTITGACTNNYLQGSHSFSIVHVKKDFTMNNSAGLFYFVKDTLNTSTLLLTVDSNFVMQSGTTRITDSKGTTSVYIGKDLNMNASSATLIGQYRSTSATTTSITVNHDVNITDGFFAASYGLGDLTFAVNHIFNMDAGTFYGISNTNSGNYAKGTFNINNIDYDGGKLIFRNAYLTDGRSTDLTVPEDININFTSATDTVVIENIASTNNAKVNLNVTGNFVAAGNSSGYFMSSGNSGTETVNINGNMNISGGNIYFAGNTSGSTTGHNIKTTIGGDVNVSGGNIYFATETGTDTLYVTNNFNISGGVASVKWNAGTTLFTVANAFSQSGGTLNMHNRNAITTNVISMIVNGTFSQTNGTFNFDSYSGGSATLATHTLTLYGSTYTIGGTGIFTHANSGTSNTVFGEIYFARNGTITYSRTTSTHDVQQVKMIINSATTLDASGSSNALQMTSHPSSSAAVNNSLTVNGTLTMGLRAIIGRQLAGNYSQMTVNSGGRVRTQHTGGFYQGSATLACLNAMIVGVNTVNFSLDPNSTIEYYGTNTQQITGVPAGIATGTQNKYGRLDINFQGAANTSWTYPLQDSTVFIRTSLVLTAGELNLDNDHLTANGGRQIIVEAGGTISRTNGYIRSEVENGTGMVLWYVTGSGSYTVPFGYNASEYIPFTFTNNNAVAMNFYSGTFHTATDNTPYPPGVTHVRNNSNVDNSANTVDRFWKLLTSSAVTANLRFTATSAEVGSIVNPRSQRWLRNVLAWEPSQGVQSNPTSVTNLSNTITGHNSWWTLSSAANPLPVELMTFDAVCMEKNIRIAWTTASEINNDFFTVEKGKTISSMKPYRVIKGNGNSNVLHNYECSDPDPFDGTTYYRLKQTDYNGQYSYSTVVNVNNCNTNNLNLEYALFTGHTLELNVSSDKIQELKVRMIDMQGKQILDKTFISDKGTNLINFEMDNISKGIYFVTLQSDQQSITRKLVTSSK